MIYYKSSLSKDFGVNDLVKLIGSLVSRLIYGSWLHYTFIIFEFGNEGNEGKISLDYSDQGIRISTDERIMENRRDTEIDC
jgi:hypothetical protein